MNQNQAGLATVGSFCSLASAATVVSHCWVVLCAERRRPCLLASHSLRFYSSIHPSIHPSILRPSIHPSVHSARTGMGHVAFEKECWLAHVIPGCYLVEDLFSLQGGFMDTDQMGCTLRWGVWHYLCDNASCV